MTSSPHMLSRVLAVPLLFVFLFGAQQRAPATLTPDELATRTLAALEELTRLEAKAVADREAFKRNEADLHEAIAAIQKPLPQRPLPLERIEGYEKDYIQEQLRLSEAFRKAWAKRQSRYQLAAKTLESLRSLSGGLRETHETLFDRIAALRPLLIEAQRRVDRRDLTLEQLGLEEGTRSIAEWITRSAEIASQRARASSARSTPWSGVLRPTARRRIKKRFDELGIVIPFPQRVVHHVYEGNKAKGAPEAVAAHPEPAVPRDE